MYRVLFIIVTIMLPNLTIAQAAPSGSATLSEADCLDVVDGRPVDDMIAEVGSIEKLHELAVLQIVEIDKWVAEAEEFIKHGVQVAEVKAAIDEAIKVRQVNYDLQLALECRMAG